MKRYLLFIYDAMYPAGGINDFFGAFDSTLEAIRAYSNTASNYAASHYAHIYDCETKTITEILENHESI